MLLISWLLIGESLWTAMWLTQRIGMLVAYDDVALSLLGARALTALAQFVAGWWLQRALPPARTLATAAFAASALLLVFELGFRLAPTSVVPGWEWIYVGAYAAYSGVAIITLRRVTDH